MDREINYWVMTPGENAEHWEPCRKMGLIGVGDEVLGDFRRYNDVNELKNVLIEVFDEYLKNKKDPQKSADILCEYRWNFYKNIKIGDIIVANNGIGKIVGIGIVTSDYYFDNEKMPQTYLCRFRNVKWIYSPDKYNGYNISDKIKNRWAISVILLDKDRELIKNVINELNLNIGHFMPDNKNIPDLYQKLLLTKKQTIFYGPPGTGKTYQARRLAVEIIEEVF